MSTIHRRGVLLDGIGKELVRSANGGPRKTLSQWLATLQNSIELEDLAETFTSGDATPDVSGSAKWITAGSTAITDFDGATEGQVIHIYRGDADIVITRNASLIETLDAANITLTATHPMASFRSVSGVWREIERSNSVITATGSSTERTLGDRFADVINLEDRAGTGGLTFDDSTAASANDTIFAAILEEAALANKLVYAPRARTLWLNVCLAEIEGDLHLEFCPGFLIKGLRTVAASSPGTILTIDGTTYRPRVYWTRPRVDNSLRRFVSADASGTAITLKNLSGGRIEDCYIVGRNDYRQYTDGSDTYQWGDSGFSVNQCGPITFDGGYIRGQPDKGIYITGGPLDTDDSTATTSDEDDYGHHVVTGIFFDSCNTMASANRESRGVKYIANHGYMCRLGVGTAEAGSGGSEVDPGRTLIAIGNTFERIGGRAVFAHGGYGHVVHGNQVIDQGYAYDTTLAPSHGSYDTLIDDTANDAFRLAGARNGSWIGNSVRYRYWTPRASSRGFRLMELALVSGTLQATGNVIDGNSVSATEIGIAELNSSSANGGTNRLSGCTTNVSRASGSTSFFDSTDSEGAAIVSSDADFTLTPTVSKRHQIHTGTLTATRTVTLSSTNVCIGHTFRVTRSGAGHYALSIGGLASLYPGEWAEVIYNGSAWVLLQSGGEYKGSWTPAITFATPGDLSVAYSTRVGSFVKRGSLVTMTCNIITSTFTHTTASGNFIISGNPFTSVTSSGQQHYGACSWTGIDKASYTHVNARIGSASTNIFLETNGSAQTTDVIDSADTPTGGQMRVRFTLTFEV